MLFICLLLLALAQIPYAQDVMESLRVIYDRIEEKYNVGHPAGSDHSRRCALMLPSQAGQAFAAGQFVQQSQGSDIYVTSACIGTDSLGNYLGNYFENIACARKLNVPFMAIAKIFEPKSKDVHTFLASLPSMLPAPTNSSSSALMSKSAESNVAVRGRIARLQRYCRCAVSCHERGDAAWVTEIDSTVRPILQKTLTSVLQAHGPNTTIAADDLSTVPAGSVVPFVAQATVHYRCGDNFVGHYGFMPFAAVAKRIPAGTSSIYVLADSRGRKTGDKNHLAAVCDTVLLALYRYLRRHFPSSIIVIRRGKDDPLTDMARMLVTPILICSVSTFCMWPAAVSEFPAYFPLTPLVLGGQSVALRKGFFWMNEAVVKGQAYRHGPAMALVKALEQ